MRYETLLLHSGVEYDPTTGAVSVPIYQTSTFQQQAPGVHAGYEYARTGNPTRSALEQLIARLEGGTRGLAFASGMAAMSTVLMLFNAGDHLVVSDDVYGGTFRVLDGVFSRLGLEVTFVDTSNMTAIEDAIRPRTRAVLVETPTNPTLKISDLTAVSRLTARHGIMTIVDNTFLSPYLQRPLELGAAIVVHSATKYLAGHGDVVAGVVAVKDEDLAGRLAFLQNAVGAVLGPQDSWLVMRGIKTLAVRMDRAQANAARIAGWLARRPEVLSVYYPGLPGHPGHEIAARQAGGFGAMLSFVLDTPERAERLLRRVEIITLAESLGGVESLISLPAKMTHASIPPDRRRALGITDSLVRLSVGIEDAEDLIDDLERGLE